VTDFFTTEVWTKNGLVTFFVLFVIDLASRRVEIAGILLSVRCCAGGQVLACPHPFPATDARQQRRSAPRFGRTNGPTTPDFAASALVLFFAPYATGSRNSRSFGSVARHRFHASSDANGLR
jgi:hypothetical protein